jgi:hypothetical protein
VICLGVPGLVRGSSRLVLDVRRHAHCPTAVSQRNHPARAHNPVETLIRTRTEAHLSAPEIGGGCKCIRGLGLGAMEPESHASVRASYSADRTFTGSTRVAIQAGMSDAATAVIAITRPTPTNVAGSEAVTP